MKVTAFLGSPHRNGQSSRLASAILEGAEESGSEIKVHFLGSKNIKGCNGCYHCEKARECIIKDDEMQEIYADMESSDAYVFASPVYFDHVTAQFKLFVDRIFPYYHEKPLKGKKAVFVLTYEENNAEIYGEIVDWFSGMIDVCHGIKVVDSLKVHGVVTQPVKDNPELLKKAKDMGRGLGQS
ncbi:flavodoxin family protein [Candidatus Bathyarchaeota archaeon]|nr:flavodoxin family protein [Candidatus Bathyarchaeota archaeon]MBT4320438.1 flavodoxin family protein [Candidatus Bathyarchaeota archaeon]MBT4425236.1 flavodoxin family protein [Candidatus Bathyarchaeota archaeon]MBT5641521.1 flavodoxin family protein [Candidatus Bathyarchaeota archaeon]MBT6604888.1 flavodoxin family protein [Candidatus Bathyarchaeota archaeon]